jgi:hypothetical protein
MKTFASYFVLGASTLLSFTNFVNAQTMPPNHGNAVVNTRAGTRAAQTGEASSQDVIAKLRDRFSESQNFNVFEHLNSQSYVEIYTGYEGSSRLARTFCPSSVAQRFLYLKKNRGEIEDVASNNANLSTAAQLEQQESFEIYRHRLDAAMAEAFHTALETDTCLLVKAEAADAGHSFSWQRIYVEGSGHEYLKMSPAAADVLYSGRKR